IARAAAMARTMIRSSLKLLKGGDYDFEPGQISEPINNIMALFEYQARQKGVAVSVAIEKDLPELNVSILHIQRALLNVLFNALSFLDKGGEIKVSARREGGFVKVLVEDNGPGFPPELMSSGIAAYRSVRKNKAGTGLGLFGAMDTMKKHGGELAIRNRQPSGATVEFHIPIPGRKPNLNPAVQGNFIGKIKE
ncbi:MAG: HAMP domain-containing sensor histidine kinase, partial [Elusimicrobiota bacterium]|nr:HAMP domain-containing sensor histidine kinase [Elusimicrobiota bacterium]